MLVSAFLESLAAAAVQPSTAGAQSPPDADGLTFATVLGEASDTPAEGAPNEAGQQEDSGANDGSQPLPFLFLWAPPAPPVAVAATGTADAPADVEPLADVTTSGSAGDAAHAARPSTAGTFEIPNAPAPMAAAPIVADVPAPSAPNPDETPAPATDVAPAPAPDTPVQARAVPNDSMLEEFAPPRTTTAPGSTTPPATTPPVTTTPEPQPTAPAAPAPAAPQPVTPDAPANPAPETPGVAPAPDAPAPEPTPPVDSPKPGYVREAAPDPLDIPASPENPHAAAPTPDARPVDATAAALFASISAPPTDRPAPSTPAAERARTSDERRSSAARRTEVPQPAPVAERPTATPAPAVPNNAADPKPVESATPAFRLTAVRDDEPAPVKPESARTEAKPHASTENAQPTAEPQPAAATPAPAPAAHVHAPVATTAANPAAPRPAAAESPAPPAPVQVPDVPDTSETRPADPLRDITVRIPTDNDQVVSVRVSQRGESVQVGVRASNPETANVLRRDLPDLVDGLRREGFRSEVAATASSNTRLEPASDAARSDTQQNPNGHPRSRPDTDDWSEQRGRRPKPQYEAEIDD